MANGKYASIKQDGSDVVRPKSDIPPQREDETKVSWITEAKDWAGELISGQSATGRILVKCAVYCIFVVF